MNIKMSRIIILIFSAKFIINNIKNVKNFWQWPFCFAISKNVNFFFLLHTCSLLYSHSYSLCHVYVLIISLKLCMSMWIFFFSLVLHPFSRHPSVVYVHETYVCVFVSEGVGVFFSLSLIAIHFNSSQLILLYLIKHIVKRNQVCNV